MENVMQRGLLNMSVQTQWFWGLDVCPRANIFSLLHNHHLCSYSPLQQPPDQGPHSLDNPLSSQITVTQKYKWDHLNPLLNLASRPFMIWLSLIPFHSPLHITFPPTSFSWLAQFLPLPEMSVLQGWFITQISGKYHFCREDTPHPPV